MWTVFLLTCSQRYRGEVPLPYVAQIVEKSNTHFADTLKICVFLASEIVCLIVNVISWN